MPRELTAGADAAGERLDVFLATHAGSRAAAQRLIDAGHVTVDGAVRAKRHVLAGGELVRVEEPAAAEPAASVPDARFEIAWEDEHVIVVDKPAGVVVHPARGHRRGTLAQALAGRVAGGEHPERAGIVHRLDRDTSGLLVVAKSAVAARELAFAFQQHRVRKLYWAVLLKGPERNHGLIDVPLAKAGPAGQEKMRVTFKDDEGEDGDGRNARTRFMVLARAGKVAAWTALVPLTGRTHQLRAHAAAIGCPILGDGKYGGKAAHPTGAPKGLMLHAREIELPGPGRRPLRLTAGPPREFKEGLRWLGLEQPELPGASLDEWRD
jgi:RluA family pseudouridine synthase